MASGDTLHIFDAWEGIPDPSSPPAFADWTNIAANQIASYDDTTTERQFFSGVMAEYYSDGSIEAYVYYSMQPAVNSGDVQFNIAAERIGHELLDIDTDGFAAVQSTTETVPSTAGRAGVVLITLTHAQFDSIVAGEPFRLKVEREGGIVGNVVGDIRIHHVELREA